MIDYVKLPQKSELNMVLACMDKVAKQTKDETDSLKYIHFNKDKHRFEATGGRTALLCTMSRLEQDIIEPQIKENTLFTYDKAGALVGKELNRDFPDCDRIIVEQSSCRTEKITNLSKVWASHKTDYMSLVFNAVMEFGTTLNPELIQPVNNIFPMFDVFYAPVDETGKNTKKAVTFISSDSRLIFIAMPFIYTKED